MCRIHQSYRRTAGMLALLVAVMSMGCATLTAPDTKKKKKDGSWSFFKKKEYQIPQSMNVTWAYDVLTLPGKAPTRGFGGRIYFYNEKTQAIPVDGDLVVYGFDDTGKQPGQGEDLNLADKRFRFTAEQFTTHFTEGELGASYSVWIPWDEAFGPPKKIMLIPTFLTKDGRLIRGSAASLNLQGKTNEENTPGMIRQASATIPASVPVQNNYHQNQAPGGSATGQGTRTTTIQIPPSTLLNTNSVRSVQASSDALTNHPAFRDQFELQNQLLNQAQRSAANQVNNAIDSIPTNTMGAVPGLGVANNSAPQLAANSATMTQAPLKTQPTSMSTQPVFGSIQAMPPMRATTNTNNPNGWALPEFSQEPYYELSTRSLPNQPQARASQAAQQTSYPLR